MKFSDKLSKLRKEHNLSQEQLADKLDVSRQAVSKWESGQSYPDMDKIIILCKLFDCSMDELINDKEREVSEKSKRGVTEYIDELLSFITKTINMFCEMTFKQKISCIFQMGVVAAILIIIWAILGSILNSCFYGLYGLFSYNIEVFFRGIFSAIYTLCGMIICILIIAHVFKVRFLDYYVTIEDNDASEKSIEKPVDISENDKYIEKQKERIIIRDPKHSTIHFFSFLGKIVTMFLKGCALLLGFFLCISFISLSFISVMGIWYVKDGAIFLGIVISTLGMLVINYTILEFLYNFIINHKQSFKKLFYMGIISLVAIGSGFAISFASYASFKSEPLKNENAELNAHTRKIIHSGESNIAFASCTKLHYCSNLKYEVNEELDNIIIVDINHNDKYQYDLVNSRSYDSSDKIIMYYEIYPSGGIYNNISSIGSYNLIISDFKNKILRNHNYYPEAEISISSSSKNIEKLKTNYENIINK